MKRLAYLVLLAAGCAKVDSGDVLTSGFYADLRASASGDGSTTVNATLYLGNPINLNFVMLTGDDKLVATHNGADMEMHETELLNVVSHFSTFQTDAENDSFIITLERTVDAGAPSSVASLPAKFTLTGPGATSSRAQPITLTWVGQGNGEAMSWQATGDCIDIGSGTIPSDSGSYTIAANTLAKRMNATVDTCAVTLSVTRSRPGTLDPHYGKGGHFTGEQTRTINTMSTP